MRSSGDITGQDLEDTCKKEIGSMSDKSEKSAIYNILAFAFEGQHTANKIVKEIKHSGALDGYDIVAQAVVEQTDKGKVKVHEPGRGGVGAAIGAAGGGLLALIGGPVGLLAMAAAGGVVGGVAGHYLGRPISKGDLKELGEKLPPDSSAFLLLLEDEYSESVIDSMAGYNANVVTIASYTEGAVTDPEGDVVAGARLVAADAEGNVASVADMVAVDAEGNAVEVVQAVATEGDDESDSAES
jgi:uncharacterized membrane protein